jgi:hypothetical protein
MPDACHCLASKQKRTLTKATAHATPAKGSKERHSGQRSLRSAAQVPASLDHEPKLKLAVLREAGLDARASIKLSQWP